MAIYEYYCPTCREKFQERRPMSQVQTAATCTRGHRAERTLSAFATVRVGSNDVFEAPTGGGCCGGAGGCACAN